MNEEFDNLKNSIEQLEKVVADLEELSKKKDNIELINDILDARKKREIKPEFTTIITDEFYNSLKERIRKELAEECVERIRIQVSFYINTKPQIDCVVENIMQIIRGEQC